MISMVLGGFSWFFIGSRLVFHGSWTAFMVLGWFLYGSRLVFHGFPWF